MKEISKIATMQIIPKASRSSDSKSDSVKFDLFSTRYSAFDGTPFSEYLQKYEKPGEEKPTLVHRAIQFDMNSSEFANFYPNDSVNSPTKHSEYEKLGIFQESRKNGQKVLIRT